MKTYPARIKPFVDWCKSQQITTLAGIKPNTVGAYFVHLNNRKLSDYTIMGAGRALRALFNFCVREKLLAESPTATVKVSKAGKKILSNKRR